MFSWKLVSAGSVALGLTVSASAAPVTVPNGDFEDWDAVGDGGATNAGWASVPSGFTPATNVGRNDEMWTNPGNFGSGWQSNGTQPTNGKYGLQHPSDAQHVKEAPNNTLVGPFNGHFIGFVNLTEGDGAGASAASIQSGVIDNLQEGTYTLTVAFGARRGTHGGGNNPWNDYSATIGLVANPTAGTTGTSGGTALGTPSSLTIIPANVPTGSSADVALEDLVYVLNVGAGDPNIGNSFAIRLDMLNLQMQNGVPNAAQTFTQGNYDNVRLDFEPIPEPASLALMGLGALGLLRRRRFQQA